MYKIQEITIKRSGTGSNGKPYTISSVKFEGSEETYDTFDTLTVGETYDGEIVANPNPKYASSFKVKKASKASNFSSRTSEITKAVKDKATNIQVAQERKNGSIEEAANWRDATMIVNTLLANKVLVDGIDLLNHTELQKVVRNSIISWKNWFAEQKDPTSQPPFSN